MSYRLPFPLPGQYDPSGPFRNPGETNPLPSPGNIPTPCWFGPAFWSSWQTPTVGSDLIQLQTKWSSPIFDMRPDLRGLPNNVGGGFNTNRNVPGAPPVANPGQRSLMAGLPIWNPQAQLWLQFENPQLANGIAGQDLTGLQIKAYEECHVCNPQNLSSVSALEGVDVTSEFDTTGESALLGWYPLGDGNPIRFYRLRLEINLLKNVRAPQPEFTPATAPKFTIRPVMY